MGIVFFDLTPQMHYAPWYAPLYRTRAVTRKVTVSKTVTGKQIATPPCRVESSKAELYIKGANYLG